MSRIKSLFSRQPGLGCIANEDDPRDIPYVKQDRCCESAPYSSSMRKFVTILNQGRTSSCVGQAWAGAVGTMSAKRGDMYDFKTSMPSALFPYYLARLIDGGRMSDDGTRIRSAAKAIRKYGLPNAEYWPFSASRVNRAPNIKAIFMANPRKGGEYQSIKSKGQDRLDDIRDAIAAGYTVVFGTSLAKSFMAKNGPTVIGAPKRSDEILGRHAMYICGYDAKGRFEVPNSWGTRWRDNGVFLMTEDYINHSSTRDFTIVKGGDRLRKAS